MGIVYADFETKVQIPYLNPPYFLRKIRIRADFSINMERFRIKITRTKLKTVIEIHLY